MHWSYYIKAFNGTRKCSGSIMKCCSGQWYYEIFGRAVKEKVGLTCAYDGFCSGSVKKYSNSALTGK